MKHPYAPALAALLFALPAVFRAPAANPAAAPPVTAEKILMQAASPSDLRARLLQNAVQAAATRPADAGESYYYRGLSFERGGIADSAIASYRRALALRGADEDRLALVDILTRRRDPGSLSEAVALLEETRPRVATDNQIMLVAYNARLAWALTLAGHADSSEALTRPYERELTGRADWRFRMARAAVGTGDDVRAFRLLLPLAVASREQDEEVMKLLREIAERMRTSSRLDGELMRDIGRRDAIEMEALAPMKGRRISFLGRDGFRLGGVYALPEGKPPFRAAIVIVASGDTIADYDSLGVALTGAGYAPLFLDPRGWGWSLSPACPSPDTWAGREDQLGRLVARDVRSALTELAARIPVDTLHYVVGGVGSMAAIAVEAADTDHRVGALLLISPRPAPVERGAMRERLARLQIPTFYQVGPEDRRDEAITDAFYQAGNRPFSRIADARLVGSGARQYRHDPAVRQRLIRWLDETLPRGGRRSPPPSGPRRG